MRVSKIISNFLPCWVSLWKRRVFVEIQLKGEIAFILKVQQRRIETRYKDVGKAVHLVTFLRPEPQDEAPQTNTHPIRLFTYTDTSFHVPSYCVQFSFFVVQFSPFCSPAFLLCCQVFLLCCTVFLFAHQYSFFAHRFSFFAHQFSFFSHQFSYFVVRICYWDIEWSSQISFADGNFDQSLILLKLRHRYIKMKRGHCRWKNQFNGLLRCNVWHSHW